MFYLSSSTAKPIAVLSTKQPNNISTCSLSLENPTASTPLRDRSCIRTAVHCHQRALAVVDCTVVSTGSQLVPGGPWHCGVLRHAKT